MGKGSPAAAASQQAPHPRSLPASGSSSGGGVESSKGTRRCSVSKIDDTRLFPFVPGDSPTQLVMAGSESRTPPQALGKIVATKVTSHVTC